jgi:tetratricopeptide (TPR) repeat protein
LEKYQLDVNLNPENADSQFNFACLLLDNGLAEKAAPHFQKALQFRPELPEYHYKLGNAFMQSGRAEEAIGEYEESLLLRPDYMEARVNLAWILACSPEAVLRNGARAVQLALRADQLSGGKNPTVIGALAAAYAEAGKFTEAVAAVRRAMQLPGVADNAAVAGKLRADMALYQAGSPMRDPSLQRPAAAAPPK